MPVSSQSCAGTDGPAAFSPGTWEVGGWGGWSLHVLEVMLHLYRPGVMVQFSQLTCTLTPCTHIYTHLYPPPGPSQSFLPGLANYTLLCSHVSQSQKESNLQGSWEFPGLAISGPLLLLALHSPCLSLSLSGWPRQKPNPLQTPPRNALIPEH